jgi:hypothetical protein
MSERRTVLEQALSDSILNKKHLLIFRAAGEGDVLDIITAWLREHTEVDARIVGHTSQAGLEGTMNRDGTRRFDGLLSSNRLLVISEGGFAMSWEKWHFGGQKEKHIPVTHTITANCLLWVIAQPRQLNDVESENFTVVTLPKYNPAEVRNDE